MFGVIDAVLKPQSPYHHADRLFWITPRLSFRSAPFDPSDLRGIIMERTRVFDAFTAARSTAAPASVGPEAREFDVEAVAPRWFDVVGVRPITGRAFTAADHADVAIVNEDVWRAMASRGKDLADARILVVDRVLPVVGVLPHGAPPILVPMSTQDERFAPTWSTEFRLAPGVSRERAQAALDALARALTAQYGEPDAPWAFRLASSRDFRQPIDDVHKAMVLGALAVLLIACVNLAHLMMARGLAKRRELAVRMALGSGRAAAVRLVLAESAILLGGGLALGALGAIWASHVAQNAMPPDISWVSGIRFQLSWRVFALGAAAAVLAGVLFGLLPAIRIVSGVNLTDPLKSESGTTMAGGRHPSALVIAEVALALALLMGGGLLLRSVRQLRTAALGFDDRTLLTAEVGTRYGFGGTVIGTRSREFDWDGALAAVRGVPGVRDAALEAWPRTRGGAVTAELTGDSTRVINTLTYAVVSPSYLRVHGLPVLKGRDFMAGDASGNGVAILSTVAATWLYPKRDAVGHMLKLGSPKADAPWIPIVGVARTPIAPWEEQGLIGGRPAFWVVRPQDRWPAAELLVRMTTRRPQVLIDLRRTLRELPQAGAVTVQPYDRQREAEIASRDFLATVFVAMGGVGLALAALGLYGVLAYAVTRRMREFAVRVALGAEPRMIYRMVLHDGLVMLLAGTGAGAFLALASAYLFDAVLVGVYPTDAISLVAAEALLLAVGLAATLAPARRAVRANPLDVIRAV